MGGEVSNLGPYLLKRTKEFKAPVDVVKQCSLKECLKVPPKFPKNVSQKPIKWSPERIERIQLLAGHKGTSKLKKNCMKARIKSWKKNSKHILIKKKPNQARKK